MRRLHREVRSAGLSRIREIDHSAETLDAVAGPPGWQKGAGALKQGACGAFRCQRAALGEVPVWIHLSIVDIDGGRP